jgi:hypothetical protein
LKIFKWQLESDGYSYTVAGQPLTDIYYLISERAEATLPDGSSVSFPHDNVIGEVSYNLRCPTRVAAC